MGRRAVDPEERARQAEMDAARAREIAEEMQGSALALPSLRGYAPRTRSVLPKVVRQFIRETLLPDLLPRLYGTAMGTVRFEVPTEMGILTLPAPPSVQMAIGARLVEWGIGRRPLTGEDDVRRPGVVILGTMEQLADAQRAAETERMRAAGMLEDVTPLADSYALPPGHSEVFIDETEPTADATPVAETPLTAKARAILARRQGAPHAPDHDDEPRRDDEDDLSPE